MHWYLNISSARDSLARRMVETYIFRATIHEAKELIFGVGGNWSKLKMHHSEMTFAA